VESAKPSAAFPATMPPQQRQRHHEQQANYCFNDSMSCIFSKILRMTTKSSTDHHEQSPTRRPHPLSTPSRESGNGFERPTSGLICMGYLKELRKLRRPRAEARELHGLFEGIEEGYGGAKSRGTFCIFWAHWTMSRLLATDLLALSREQCIMNPFGPFPDDPTPALSVALLSGKTFTLPAR
jgi:hypothetical protein